MTPTCTGVNSPPSFSLTNNALNVSGSVSVAETGFTRNHVTGLWTSTMTVTNTSGAAITGPVQVLITNLTAGDSMANASGTHGGVAFITVTTGALAAGAQVNLMIEFNNPSNESIDFTPVPYAGGLTTP